MYKGGYVSPKVMSVKRVRYNDNEGLQDIIEYWKEYF